MTPGPSANGANGRDGSGRFCSGNRLGRGNPHARRTARLRAELLRAVTPDDVRQVALALVEKAKAGDVPAIRELFDRTIGKISPPLDSTAVPDARPSEPPRYMTMTPEQQARIDELAKVGLAKLALEDDGD